MPTLRPAPGDTMRIRKSALALLLVAVAAAALAHASGAEEPPAVSLAVEAELRGILKVTDKGLLMEVEEEIGAPSATAKGLAGPTLTSTVRYEHKVQIWRLQPSDELTVKVLSAFDGKKVVVRGRAKLRRTQVTIEVKGGNEIRFETLEVEKLVSVRKIDPVK